MIKKRISLTTSTHESSSDSLFKQTISTNDTSNNHYHNDSIFFGLDNNPYDKEFPSIQYTIPYNNLLNSPQHNVPHKRFLRELYPHISEFNIYSHKQFTLTNKLVHE